MSLGVYLKMPLFSYICISQFLDCVFWKPMKKILFAKQSKAKQTKQQQKRCWILSVLHEKCGATSIIPALTDKPWHFPQEQDHVDTQQKGELDIQELISSA